MELCLIKDVMSNVCSKGTKSCQCKHEISLEDKIKEIVESIDYDVYKELFVHDPESGEDFLDEAIEILKK